MQLSAFEANHIEAALIAAGDNACYALKLFNMAKAKHDTELMKQYPISDFVDRQIQEYGCD